MNFSFFKSLILVLLFSSSCAKPDMFVGSKVTVEKERTLSTFTKIEHEGSFNVNVTYGALQKVIIKADDNIIDKVITNVNKGVLKINLPEGSFKQFTISVDLTIPLLESIINTGSGNLSILNFNNLELLEIIDSGSGQLAITGKVNKLVINKTGSSAIKSFDLSSKECIINHTGVGNIETTCTRILSGNNSGAGNIKYKGSPEIKMNNSGAGQIINAN